MPYLRTKIKFKKFRTANIYAGSVDRMCPMCENHPVDCKNIVIFSFCHNVDLIKKYLDSDVI